MTTKNSVKSTPVPRRLATAADIPEDWLAPSEEPNPFAPAADERHRYGKGKSIVCITEARGHKHPKNLSLGEIVVNAPEGFIPLWEAGRTLHYRFNEHSMKYFRNPEKAKSAILTLFGEAVLAWGDAAPIRFTENVDTYDFEFYMNPQDDGDDNSGYVLASAFFPASGRDQVTLYPQMFKQSRKEQVETLIHEIGHIFGLRHFFAAELESRWPSEIYGTHDKFSIMNYGADSLLTDADRSDLRRLYDEARRLNLKEINRTPIVLVKPYHDLL